jgi:hypothetical protein
MKVNEIENSGHSEVNFMSPECKLSENEGK